MSASGVFVGGWWGALGRLWIGKWIIDLGALPALWRILGGQGGGSDLALRALGGVWSACGSWWGLVGRGGVLWAGAEE